MLEKGTLSIHQTATVSALPTTLSPAAKKPFPAIESEKKAALLLGELDESSP